MAQYSLFEGEFLPFGVEIENYCLSCYEKNFLSVEVDGNENGLKYDVCPYCGTAAERVKETGIVGCARCYRTLGEIVVPMVVRMQQEEADVHQGKQPESIHPQVYYENRKKELLALAIYYENLGDTQSSMKCKQESMLNKNVYLLIGMK